MTQIEFKKGNMKEMAEFLIALKSNGINATVETNNNDTWFVIF